MSDATHAIHAMTVSGLNLIQQALSIFDSDLRLAVSNRRMQELFDLPDELVTPGVAFEEVIRYLATRGEYGPLDDLEGFVATRVEQARTFAPHYMERTRANGRIIAVEGNPLPGGGWITVYTDITQTKRQEALLRARSEELHDQVLSYAEDLSAANRELAATNAALEEATARVTAAEARIRLTTEMMPAHIAHVGLDQRYTYSNRQLSWVMPGRPKEILGLHMREALGTSTYAKVRPYLDEALQGKASAFEITHDASSRRLRVAFTPDLSTGQISGVNILSMDVTEETQARVALQQSKKREMAAQLTSGLAHDFSNLLTIILGMQFKLARMPLPAEAEDLINATINAAKRGGVLLDKIAGITAGREVHLLPVKMQDFLRDLGTLARSALPEGMDLTVQDDLDDCTLLLDAGLLQDAALNLVLNARDASAPHGRITLRLRAIADTWVELSVSDTGPGFSEAALTHALDPFYTTKGGEGSGLGLSMVYDMTKTAGGTVTLGNTSQGGRVTIRLPYRAAPVAKAPRMVLLAEDSPDIRAVVRDMLTSEGIPVIEATSAEEALALAAQLSEIDFVLSDISLAGTMTGVDLRAALMHLDTPTPVTLMTSLPETHPLHAAARDGGTVLKKPFDQRMLTAAMAQEMTR
ncbi:MAG: PAS-domain containing protein [Pseudomonadota bacterium]|nr:PAS-domain containing protein [Pseudomonadota bacterium]MEE3071057.1 PAS-domain containing protein [Pseudomonadota bacterium]